MIMNSGYKVTAVGTYLPEKELTNPELEKIVDTNDEWIVKRTGIRKRHIASKDEFASNLAIKAVENLAENHPAALEDIDMIITSALVPDHLTPSISALVAGHFNMRKAGTYDLHAACTGFAYGLITANSYILSGLADKVLIITAETPSKVIDYTDRNTCILFGDGATAVLVEKNAQQRLFAADSGTDGSMADKLYCSQFSSSIGGVPLLKEHYFWQDGGTLYSYVVRNVSDRIKAFMAECAMTAADIDWFIPHSANLRMIDAMRQRLGFEKSQMLISVEDCGNTSSSSIPLALAGGLKDGRVRRGDKILMYGFGGGITYAGAVVEW